MFGNWLAFGFILIGMLIGATIGKAFPTATQNQQYAIVCGVILMIDVAYRLARSKDVLWKRLVLPTTGGHLWFLPLWGWTLVGAMYFAIT